jgi:hypothetical protein
MSNTARAAEPPEYTYSMVWTLKFQVKTGLKTGKTSTKKHGLKTGSNSTKTWFIDGYKLN